jgi:hypothetical protein
MRFGTCYELLENGGFIAREGWNKSFLWLKKKTEVKSDWCKDPILKAIADANGGVIEAEQTICKYDAEKNKIVSGWVPQQEDLAATDWVETKMDFSKKNDGFVGDLFDGADVFRKP